MNIVRGILRRGIKLASKARIISVKTAARLYFLIFRGRFPNFTSPEEFDDKMMWMEFNTDTTIWSQLSDKLEVRKFIEAKGLKHILIPLVEVFDSPSDIRLKNLPDKFALKSNHACSQVMIIGDASRFDEKLLQKTAARWLNIDYGRISAEPHYSRIRPRIYAEELLPLNQSTLPVDYKIYCFNGKPLLCMLCPNRDPESLHSAFMFYTMPDWTPRPDYLKTNAYGNTDFPRPENMDEIMETVSNLAAGFIFVRVDIYIIENKIFFGELAFTPAALRSNYYTAAWQKYMGYQIKLPPKGYVHQPKI